MPETDNFIRIPESVCTDLEVSVGEHVTVGIGNRNARARIASREGDSAKSMESVLLSDRLAATLNVPAGFNLGVIQAGNKLKVGPLIGILAKQYKNGTFGQDSFYRKLIYQLKKLNCMGMVFTPQSIDWERQLINGYWLPNNGSNEWKHRMFPFPDVVYNRYFRKDGDPWSYPILHRMSKSGVKSFNAPIGSKWKIHRLLSQVSDVKKHIPETQVLDGVKTLQNMLEKHRQVYVKPAGGCQGRGISRIRKSNGAYLCQGTKENQEYKYDDIARVYRKTKATSKTKVMLVQQAITCPSKSGHFDVRAMVQKDSSNTWKITGLAARMGVKGRVTTNLHTGGKAARLEEILSKCGFDQSEISNIVATIKKLALRIAESIESHAQPIGEIGLDFIIDAEGNVWFLEANSKPGRKAFSSIEASGEDRLTIVRPMLYARHLAGF